MIKDSKVQTNFCKTMIESNLGLKVKILGKATEGLSECNSTKFKIIITDANLPGINGETFIKQLKGSNGSNKDTSFIMITAENMPIGIVAAHINVVPIRKSIRKEEIILALKEFLG